MSALPIDVFGKQVGPVRLCCARMEANSLRCSLSGLTDDVIPEYR